MINNEDLKPVIEVENVEKKLGEQIDGVIGYEVIEKGDDGVVLRVNSTSFIQPKRII